MNKIEYVKKALSGEEMDTVPHSFWAHLPEIDRDPEKLAEGTYDMYKQYDLSVIKTMNNGMYMTEDHGTSVDYSEMGSGGVSILSETPIHTVDDWDKIQYTAIDEGALARELKSLELLLDLVQGEAPVIFTVFSPLTTANKLSQGKVMEHLKEDEDKVIRTLEVLAKIGYDLSKKAIELGAAGVYFATQLANYDSTTEEEYIKYGKTYDLQVLEGAQDGWLNTLHIHGENAMFSVMQDYPTQVINWHVWESLPEIKEGIDFSGKTIMTGILDKSVTEDDRNALRNQIYHVLKDSGMRNVILAPTCVTRFPYDEATVEYVFDIKKQVENILNQ